MSGDLLQTKLYVPRLRPSLIPRPHLIQKLNQDLHRKLTLISAPAGFGKTTLITDWLSQLDRPVGWISLDEDDSDLQQFFNYVAAAIRPFPDSQHNLTNLLQSVQPVPAKALAAALVNDLASVATPCLLVLDDYHEIESAEIDLALGFILDHMPPNLHLIITSRADPGFPLSRLRARNQLTELRADDLRFSVEETAVFLQTVMGISLTPEQIAALEARTEGWVAGLQMAALSMQNRDDVASFIDNFTGSHRFIMDYLLEEVLNQQSVEVQAFLLETAVLTQLCADLCDAVRQSTASQQILEQLETHNIFLIPLDNERRWYRYHHLFADLLRQRLQQQQPELVPQLHQRASDWYAANGRSPDAIRHALAANDFERAAGQIEPAWRKMERSFQGATWLSWVQDLPEKLIRQRPVLCAGYAWALLDTGQFEQIEKVKSLLDQAEQWLETPTADMIVVDKKQFNSLPAKIAAARAYIAHAIGDLPATMQYAQLTLDLLPKDDHFYRGIPTITLGLAQWANGDLVSAFKSATDAVTNFQMANNDRFALAGNYVMAELKVAQGDLDAAAQIYRQSLNQLTEREEPLLSASANLHRGLSMIFFEQDDMEAFEQHFEQSKLLNKQAGLDDSAFPFLVVQAKLKRAQGDIENAIDLLDKAQASYSRGRMPDIAPIGALKSRMLITDGQLTKAEQWASEQSLTVGDELSYLREYDHLTFARLLIARFRQEKNPSNLSDAQTLLTRLLAAAESGGRLGRVVEILMLQALVYEVQHDTTAALGVLARALTLAEPAGYVRMFVDEGLPMMRLLQKINSEEAVMKRYCHTLLNAFGVQIETQPSSRTPQPLVDPLSERELEILALITAGLKNKEIAAQLVISLNTVLYHNKNIYSKLGVKNRALAIVRARELGLIA